MTSAPGSALAARVHWVVAELDARGEIDAHAALCLRHAIGAAHTRAVQTILVDLRDLTAINRVGVALLRAHAVDCQAHDQALGLLISGEERHRQIAEALERGGLGDALHYTDEPPCRAPRSACGSSIRRRASAAGAWRAPPGACRPAACAGREPR